MSLVSVMRALLAAALFAAGDNDGERYRALTAALTRGAFPDVPVLAQGFVADSPFARKAAQLERLARFLAGGTGSDAATIPPLPRGVVEGRAGALTLVLSEDGAFAAAVRPEQGACGFQSLLFGLPEPWTSRLSLSIDGEARMLSPHPGLQYLGNGLSLSSREGEVEVALVLRGSAPRADDGNVVSASKVRIEATVTNRGGGVHRVGMRLLLDLVDGFDDAPEVRLGMRKVLATTSEFEGDAVPGLLHVGAGAVSHSLALRGPSAPAPDRVLLAPLALMLTHPFEFELTPDAPLSADSALAVYADPAELAPGEARALVVELGGEPAPLDERPPVATRCWWEPLFHRDAMRVVVALENGVAGATGPCSDLEVGLELSPALDLLAQPDDFARLGDLPRDALLQRSVVVRPNFAQGGGQLVRFDVSTARTSDRSRKALRVDLPTPGGALLSGRILDVQGRPVPGAEVVLQRDGVAAARTTSDGNGGYGFANVSPGACQVLAQKVVWVEPAAKANRADVGNLLYDVLLTSATIDDAGRTVLPAFLPGTGRDVVLAHATTRYSLFVSVEWDAQRSYLEQVGRGMRRAAEFLYSASDGQITFGRVVVADNGVNWNTSDLWDWACNHIHPNASVSGIRHRYDPVTTPWNTAINFGRDWNGPWDALGHYSTIVHEFGHYGLGLYDEYLGAPQGEYRGLSYWEMCRCIMGYQYSDWKICWQGNHQSYTNQGMWNGRSCWQQIEEWHEGMRGGFYCPVTTPAERNGVIPPPITNHVGDEVAVVIRDTVTGGFDAPLRVAGLNAANQSGILVYVDQKSDGRSLYQGVTWGDGRMQLMGAHVGDKVWGVKDGLRAETVVAARRDEVLLEFDSEPGPERGPPPLVLVHPERGGGRDTGALLEIVPLRKPDGLPVVHVRGATRREVRLEAIADAKSGVDRFVGSLSEEELATGRLALDILLPDANRGDLTIVTDVVRVPLPADVESEAFSFDGSLRVRLPAGTLGAALPLCIASTAGPPLMEEGKPSIGRVHSLLLGSAGVNAGDPRLHGTLTLVFHVPEGTDPGQVEPRRLDEGSGAFVPLPFELTSPRELLATLDAPGVVALFER